MPGWIWLPGCCWYLCVTLAVMSKESSFISYPAPPGNPKNKSIWSHLSTIQQLDPMNFESLKIMEWHSVLCITYRREHLGPGMWALLVLFQDFALGPLATTANASDSTGVHMIFSLFHAHDAHSQCISVLVVECFKLCRFTLHWT